MRTISPKHVGGIIAAYLGGIGRMLGDWSYRAGLQGRLKLTSVLLCGKKNDRKQVIHIGTCGEKTKHELQ